MTINTRILLLLLAFLIPGVQLGAQTPDVPRATSALALTNATVIAAPGDTILNTTVVVEDGLIRSVGARVPIPNYARQVACDSLFVYAGFIDGLGYTGVIVPEEEKIAGGNNEQTKKALRTAELAGVTPERSAIDYYNSGDKGVDRMRRLGFTASHIVPKGGMLPGKGTLVVLGSAAADKMVLADRVSLLLEFKPSREVYPRTTIGVMAKFRELYRQAELLNEHSGKYAEGGKSGIVRPRSDRSENAMMQALNMNTPVYVVTRNTLDLHKALSLSDELGFTLVPSDVKQSEGVLDLLKIRDRPVLVSLDLPSYKTPEKDDEHIDAETLALRERREKSVHDHYRNAGLIAETGVPVAFSTLSVKKGKIRENIATMIEFGLQEEDALRALTTAPAEILGVQNMLGSVTAGKIANLVVTDGNYFDKASNVRFVIVEGELFEYEPGKNASKKGLTEREDVSIDLAGVWSYEARLPDGLQTGILEITGSDGDYTGVLIEDDNSRRVPLQNIVVEGNVVTFSFRIVDGTNSLPINIEFVVEDDFFEGEAMISGMGTFPIEGVKGPGN